MISARIHPESWIEKRKPYDMTKRNWAKFRLRRSRLKKRQKLARRRNLR